MAVSVISDGQIFSFALFVFKSCQELALKFSASQVILAWSEPIGLENFPACSRKRILLLELLTGSRIFPACSGARFRSLEQMIDLPRIPACSEQRNRLSESLTETGRFRPIPTVGSDDRSRQQIPTVGTSDGYGDSSRRQAR